MELKTLSTEEQLKQIKEATGYTVIFKHNTTCPISKSVKRSVEGELNKFPENTSLFILDLLEHRNISDAIAEQFDVVHESPQLLLINSGACKYHSSLFNISVDDTVEAIEKN